MSLIPGFITQGSLPDIDFNARINVDYLNEITRSSSIPQGIYMGELPINIISDNKDSMIE